MKNKNFEKSLQKSRGIAITKQHTKFHWAASISLGGTRYQEKTMFFQENRRKSVKNKNFEKSLQTSRGIAITKQHTKFHWAASNSLGGTRYQKKVVTRRTRRTLSWSSKWPTLTSHKKRTMWNFDMRFSATRSPWRGDFKNAFRQTITGQ